MLKNVFVEQLWEDVQKIHPVNPPQRISPSRFPSGNSLVNSPAVNFSQFRNPSDAFLISLSVSFLHNLFFCFWIWGECNLASSNITFASKTRQWKNPENVSNIFEKNLSKDFIKSSKNATKIFKKYLLHVSFLLFYWVWFRFVILLF